MKCFRFIKLSWLPAVTISGENLIGKQAFLPFSLVFCFPILPHPNLPTTPQNHTHTTLWRYGLPHGCQWGYLQACRSLESVPLHTDKVSPTTAVGPRRKFKPRSWTHLSSIGRCSVCWRKQAFALELLELIAKWQRGLWNESSHWTMVPIVNTLMLSLNTTDLSIVLTVHRLKSMKHFVCAFPRPLGDRGELSHLVWVENLSMEMSFVSQIAEQGIQS